MSESKIEWTERTWNPVVGCSLESPGCAKCYAMKMAGRLEAMGVPAYQGTTMKTKAGFVWTGKIGVQESVMLEPLRRKKPTTYFVNSMSDLFHPDVPDEVIDRVFAVMALCPQHTFQVLTKRAGRMREYLAGEDREIQISAALGNMLDGDWIWNDGKRFRHAIEKLITAFMGAPQCEDDDYEDADDRGYLPDPMPLPNVWLGVSVEDQKRADERIPDLLATPAAVRFLSCEPLLGPLSLEESWHGENALSSECWGECGWCEAGHPPLYNCQRGRQEGGNWFDHPKGRSGLDWVICGGESGPGARPMHPDWARSLRDQCASAGVPFFFKQWGDWAPHYYGDRCVTHEGRNLPNIEPAGFNGDGTARITRLGKKRAGRLLDGVEHNGMPRR